MNDVKLTIAVIAIIFCATCIQQLPVKTDADTWVGDMEEAKLETNVFYEQPPTIVAIVDDTEQQPQTFTMCIEGGMFVELFGTHAIKDDCQETIITVYGKEFEAAWYNGALRIGITGEFDKDTLNLSVQYIGTIPLRRRP